MGGGRKCILLEPNLCPRFRCCENAKKAMLYPFFYNVLNLKYVFIYTLTLVNVYIDLPVFTSIAGTS